MLDFYRKKNLNTATDVTNDTQHYYLLIIDVIVMLYD